MRTKTIQENRHINLALVNKITGLSVTNQFNCTSLIHLAGSTLGNCQTKTERGKCYFTECLVMYLINPVLQLDCSLMTTGHAFDVMTPDGLWGMTLKGLIFSTCCWPQSKLFWQVSYQENAAPDLCESRCWVEALPNKHCNLAHSPQLSSGWLQW